MPTRYQPMMSLTLGTTPVPTQYQQNVSFNGPAINHNSYQFNQAGPHLNQGGQFNQAGQFNESIQNNGGTVVLDQSQLTRTKEWAKIYGFHVKAVPPFLDLTRSVVLSNKPIISIKNIPYNITHCEIQQFVSDFVLPEYLTHLSAPGTSSLPILIMMERCTGKTKDCFIEMPSPNVAAACIERVENLVMDGRPPRMAQRVVTVEMSCQGELMRELFPRAKNIRWDPTTGSPIRLPVVNGYGGSFLTRAELKNVVRFAKRPQGSWFTVGRRQRTYAFMISTLAKFPWASVYYTLEDRDLLFKAYHNQLCALLYKILVEDAAGLDAGLVAAFVDAGVNCPGFSESQKACIYDAAGLGYNHRGVSHFGAAWPFETLSKPAGVGDYDILLWINLMKTGALSAMAQNILLAVGCDGKNYAEVGFDQWGQLMMNISEEGRKNISFAGLACMEQELMECMLTYGRKVFVKRTGLDFYPGDQEEKKMPTCWIQLARHPADIGNTIKKETIKFEVGRKLTSDAPP
ncbi:hypothetical protein DV735_g2568, partial [Chaetothyriales sp. CBS 134920]